MTRTPNQGTLHIEYERKGDKLSVTFYAMKNKEYFQKYYEDTPEIVFRVFLPAYLEELDEKIDRVLASPKGKFTNIEYPKELVDKLNDHQYTEVYKMLFPVPYDTRTLEEIYEEEKPPTEVPTSQVVDHYELPVCLDNLAYFFGDTVLLKKHGSKYLNPFNGTFVEIGSDADLFACIPSPKPEIKGGHYCVSSSLLLSIAKHEGCTRLALPYKWNPNATGYMTVVELQELYNLWKKEQKDASSS